MYADVIRAMNLDKSCVKLDSSKIIGVLLIKNIINIENFNKVYLNKENNYRDYLCIDIVGKEVVYKITNGMPEDYNTFEITDDNNIKVTVKTLYNTIEKLKYAMVEDIMLNNKKRYEEYLKNTTFSLDVIRYLHKTILAENWVNDFLNNPNDFIKTENEFYQYNLNEVQTILPYIHKEYFERSMDALKENIIKNHNELKNSDDAIVSLIKICKEYIQLLRILPEKRFSTYFLNYSNNIKTNASIFRYYVNHEEIFLKNVLSIYSTYNDVVNYALTPILNKIKEHRLDKELTEFNKLCEHYANFLLTLVKDFDLIEITNKCGESIRYTGYKEFLSYVTDSLLIKLMNDANNKVNKYNSDYSYTLGDLYFKIGHTNKVLYNREKLPIDNLDIYLKETTFIEKLVKIVDLKITVKENF